MLVQSQPEHDILLPVIATYSLGVLEQMYGVGSRYLYSVE